MNPRINSLRKIIKRNKLDSLVIFSAANVSYLTRKVTRDSYLLITQKKSYFFTDSRYIEESKRNLPAGFILKEVNSSLPRRIIEVCLKNKLRRIGFEESSTFYSTFRKLNNHLKGKSRLVPVSGMVEELRQIKSASEIAKIRKGVRIIFEAFIFIRKFLRGGRKEIEIVAEFERFIRYRGAQGSAFSIIVAAGKNSSHPHHLPGQKRLIRGEPVLIDIGVEYEGYKSDITRVFSVGRPSRQLDRIYDIVLGAQEAAIASVRPGIRAKEIDSAGRNYIKNHGLGKQFVHSIGHGVGVKVHEWPQISPDSTEEIRPGMVFTIEPAVYLADKFGIRIEDMVLVTRSGCEVLSRRIPK
jgi:Xaa-Pro aminopeptidase